MSCWSLPCLGREETGKNFPETSILPRPKKTVVGDDSVLSAIKNQAEIQKIKDGTVEEKDLQKVKETQRQSRIKSLKQNRFWQSQMQQSFLNGTQEFSFALSRAPLKYCFALSRQKQS